MSSSSSPPPADDDTSSSSSEVLCFQDVMKAALLLPEDDDNDETTTRIANACFELANAKVITYRLNNENENENNNDTTDDEDTPKKQTKKKKKKKKKKKQVVSKHYVLRIRQDMEQACGQHTGGIVWETSYLLLSYLLSLRHHHHDTTDDITANTTISRQKKYYPCGKRALEVGAGCGLLGLGLYHAQLAKHVILTETESVLSNLQYNVSQNNNTSDNNDNNNDKKKKKKTHHHHHQSSSLQVSSLDWTRYKEDCQASHIEPHSMDFIVGTDVVFSKRFVGPLLETLRYLSHEKTTILLCVQERCPDAHRLLLSSCTSYGLSLQDITQQVTTQVPACQWGTNLECCIFKLQVIPAAATTKTNSDSHTTDGPPSAKKAKAASSNKKRPRSPLGS